MKDNHNLKGLKMTFDYLKTHTASMGMISRALHIPQKDIKNYVRELERKNLVSQVEKRRCLKAGSIAWWYTSSPKLFPIPGAPAKSNTIEGVCCLPIKKKAR